MLFRWTCSGLNAAGRRIYFKTFRYKWGKSWKVFVREQNLPNGLQFLECGNKSVRKVD